MEASTTLADLVFNIERLAALYELENLDRDTAVPEQSAHYVRQPASAEDIETLEQHLRVRLPDDYKEFLTLKNGWRNFSGDYSLLSISDMSSPAVLQRITEFRGMWHEDEKVQRGVFIYLGHGQQFGFYDFGDHAAGPVLHFYEIGESTRYESFTEYLVSEKKALERSLFDLGWGTESV